MIQQQTIYTDRSRYIAYQRCKRLRWLGYHEGEAGLGLTPKKKSIHVVIGSAVHAGMEVLLREGQAAVDAYMAQWPKSSLEEALNYIFAVKSSLHGVERPTEARQIEDRAVAAALADFEQEFGSEGVELDPDEAAAVAAVNAAGNLVQITGTDLLLGQLRGSLAREREKEQESPIIVDFGDLGPQK